MSVEALEGSERGQAHEEGRIEDLQLEINVRQSC